MKRSTLLFAALAFFLLHLLSIPPSSAQAASRPCDKALLAMNMTPVSNAEKSTIRRKCPKQKKEWSANLHIAESNSLIQYDNLEFGQAGTAPARLWEATCCNEKEKNVDADVMDSKTKKLGPCKKVKPAPTKEENELKKKTPKSIRPSATVKLVKYTY